MLADKFVPRFKCKTVSAASADLLEGGLNVFAQQRLHTVGVPAQISAAESFLDAAGEARPGPRDERQRLDALPRCGRFFIQDVGEIAIDNPIDLPLAVPPRICGNQAQSPRP